MIWISLEAQVSKITVILFELTVLAQQLHSEMEAAFIKDWDKNNCVFKSLCQVNLLFSMHV